MESAHVQAGDIRVHYRHAGTGTPVILIHGYPETSHEWRIVGPLLARSHSVFALDTRGHGGTDKPGDGYTRRQLAADIVNVLDALGLDDAAIVGHDWGGIIACKLALEWPERVSRLAMVDTICTGWPPFVDYYYWFMAAPLPEQFFARYHRQYIETPVHRRQRPTHPAGARELVAPDGAQNAGGMGDRRRRRRLRRGHRRPGDPGGRHRVLPVPELPPRDLRPGCAARGTLRAGEP
jgi:pimeloyl-ACP methyl ester carboxylesterase